MKILVILGHPRKESFNHAIAEKAISTLEKQGHKVIFHDLYKEKFNPILPAKEIPLSAKLDKEIKKHCEELASADGIVIVHPNWWGQPPAILKGWVDRIIRAGVAYKFEDSGEGLPIGLLKAEKVIIFNTSNTPAEREKHHFGDPLETLWKTCIFDFCGIKKFVRRMFSVVVLSTPEQRKTWLEEVESIILKEFPK